MNIIKEESNLPTLYEYYTAGGVHSGLTFDGPQFKLNGKDITIFSGTMHYFRVPKQYWRDRLRKMRAAGLLAVESYIAWNLHEPELGTYDFGDGGSDMKEFLDFQEFFRVAQEEDLLAIVRPGPFICSEWEFGGLPSWLLREENIKIRTSDPKFMKHVERYFHKLMPLLAKLQFIEGGPIIAMQIENEYGGTKVDGQSTDKDYLKELKYLMEKNGIKGLFVTSDSGASHWDAGSVPGTLKTINFGSNPEVEFKNLQEYQPNKPIMVMEYWTGWYDHWSEKHYKRSAEDFANVYQQILKYPASANMLMFTGGSNWGFFNGANLNNGELDNSGFQPITSSYDFDAPIGENGDYTDKYVKVKEIINSYNKIKTKLPVAPHLVPRFAYPSVTITHQITLEELLANLVKINSSKLLSMDVLPINNNSGQSYGYVIYRKTDIDIDASSILKIQGRVCDTVMVLVNGRLVSKPLQDNSDLDGFGYWRMKDSTLNLGPNVFKNATLDLVVEHWGRIDFGSLPQFNKQFKGLWQGPVSLNDRTLTDWEIYPLEFKKNWITSLKGWHTLQKKNTSPALYRAKFMVDELHDSYIDMRKWTKGLVIVNDFVLSKYAIIGPQMSIYLPAPLLRKGRNEIIVFEHFEPSDHITFVTDPIYK